MPQAPRSPRGLLHTFPSSPSLTHSSCSSEDTLLFKFTEEKGNSMSFPAFSWEVGKILDSSHTAPCRRSFPSITLSSKHSHLYASQSHLVCWSTVLRLQPQHQGAHVPPPHGKSTQLPERTYSLNEHFSGIKNWGDIYSQNVTHFQITHFSNVAVNHLITNSPTFIKTRPV